MIAAPTILRLVQTLTIAFIVLATLQLGGANAGLIDEGCREIADSPGPKAGTIPRLVTRIGPNSVGAAQVVEPDCGALLLTAFGERFCGSRMTQLVQNYVNVAELSKRGSCHLFRHTMATLQAPLIGAHLAKRLR